MDTIKLPIDFLFLLIEHIIDILIEKLKHTITKIKKKNEINNHEVSHVKAYTIIPKIIR